MLLAVCSTEVMAGGLVTNSNQSASFLRNPARDAVIDIDGVYTNPAGVCFMPNGFHLGLSAQHAEQQRNVTTSLLLFKNNMSNPDETHVFNGKAVAPIVPSFQAAYVMDKWTVSASFAVSGGGGKCTFDDGIGSIETLYSTELMQTAAALGLGQAYKGYSFDSYMSGRQYYFGIQLGAGYKVNDNLAVFGGLRTVIGSSTYTGYARNVKLHTIVPGKEIIPLPAEQADVEMTTDQSCVGFTPVIGVDYKLNDQWNFAFKYEFRTKMNLENSSDMNAVARSKSALDKFNDQKNKYVRDDIPATFTFGVQYSPVENVRINGGFHYYDDCNAKKGERTIIGKNGQETVNEEDLINGGTCEFLLGAEWDATKLLTVSAGWQNTHYDLSDAYMQDMSYNLSSNMICFGVRLNLSEKINVDLGYMHNFYEDRTVNTALSSTLVKTDVYERKNDAFAVGVNFNF